MAKMKGFTLAELLVTVTVFALLMTMGLPGLISVMRINQSAAVSNGILGDLLFARRMAVSLGRTVTLCKSTDGMTCAGSWSDGWILYSDHDADGSLEAADGDTLLRATDHLPSGYNVKWIAFGSTTRLQFEPTGATRWQNGTFYVCPPDDDPAYARAVIVYRTGRSRMSTDSDGDGVHENANGDPITCP